MKSRAFSIVQFVILYTRKFLISTITRDEKSDYDHMIRVNGWMWDLFIWSRRRAGGTGGVSDCDIKRIGNKKLQ